MNLDIINNNETREENLPNSTTPKNLAAKVIDKNVSRRIKLLPKKIEMAFREILLISLIYSRDLMSFSEEITNYWKK